MATTRVYIADLRHNYGGVLSTDVMPLSAGYMKAVMDVELAGQDVDVQIFSYPDDLLSAMDEQAPHVLMLSNYVWNEALSLYFFRRAKAIDPSILTVMGGPNISDEAERQTAQVAQHPEIDIYVLGEGDFLASDIVKEFLDTDRSVEAVAQRDIPSSILRQPDGVCIRNERAGRNPDVNQIPSPWTTGIMDKFFDGKMAPIIETNRGCPFRCTFCVQGTSFYSRITSFGMDRLKDEIDYIGRTIQQRSPSMGTLRIADANYGMYPRDVEISEYIGKGQRDYGYPTFIDATTGKNQAERIIESMEKVNGALVLYQAVQSLDDEVLRNIKRDNIKIDVYEKLQVHVRGRGLRTSSDLILGLPGESQTSHLTALYKLIDAGTHQIHCFQSMLLRGAELERIETRAKYDFTTRFRVLPKNYGEYDNEKVFDIEEIVVATASLPYDDYITCRKHHFNFSLSWNDGWFAQVAEMAQRRFDVKPSEWLNAMLVGIEADQGTAGQLLRDFVDETNNELFESREECAEFYSKEENFERLKQGEIGDNLMYKYRAKASFFAWKELCANIMDSTRTMLIERGAQDMFEDFDGLWNDFHAYIEALHATGTSVEEIVKPVSLSLSYDIDRWIKDETPQDISSYRLDQPQAFVFRLTPQGAAELESALNVWTAQLTGLTKLVTRIRVYSQVRRCQPEGAAAPVS